MTDSMFVILYVDNAAASAAFYSCLFDKMPVAGSATFISIELNPGLTLGLWSRNAVRPDAASTVGGGEIGFVVNDHAAVDATCAEWTSRGVEIHLAPVDTHFGRTFVALDPDGHHIRVLCPAD